MPDDLKLPAKNIEKLKIALYSTHSPEKGRKKFTTIGLRPGRWTISSARPQALPYTFNQINY
jgi:hypothetical protein